MRFPRFVAPGYPHHVLQRGNRKSNIFGDDSDRYVLQNPVRAGLVAKAEDFLWSSAAARCGLRDDALIVQEHPLVREISDWSAWLKIEGLKENDLIRRHTRTGRPLGSKEFLTRMEAQTGRKLLPQRRGPQRRSLLESLLPNQKESYWGDLDV